MASRHIYIYMHISLYIYIVKRSSRRMTGGGWLFYTVICFFIRRHMLLYVSTFCYALLYIAICCIAHALAAAECYALLYSARGCRMPLCAAMHCYMLSRFCTLRCSAMRSNSLLFAAVCFCAVKCCFALLSAISCYALLHTAIRCYTFFACIFVVFVWWVARQVPVWPCHMRIIRTPCKSKERFFLSKSYPNIATYPKL